MANFKTTIITKKGHALMAKLSANVATMKFTKICSSDFDYSNLNNSELEQVITFKNLKQTVLPDLITVVNTATVKVSATITNTNLSEGYYLRAIGLFALDPDDGEILYSITPTSEADYMAADNGITKSGISLDLLTTISNSENVNLEIDPNATISADTFYNVVGDVAALENEGSNLVDGINKNTTSLNANTQNIANLKNGKADLASPNFTGTPTIKTKRIATTEYVDITQANILNGFTIDTTQENSFLKIENINKIKLVLISSTDVSSFTDVIAITSDCLPLKSYVAMNVPDDNGNIVKILASNSGRVQVKGMKANVKLYAELTWIGAI